MGVIFRNGVAYGGSISIPIEAEERQTVIGDGEQRGIGGSYFDLFISNEDSESGKDEYFLSGSIQQGLNPASSSFSFGGGLNQINEKTIERNGQQITVKEFSPQCHIKVGDSAKAEFDGSSWFGVHGGSIVDIGEDVVGSPGFTLWQNEQDRSTSLIYPKAFIHNAAYLVIDDGYTHLGPPVMTVHGGCIIDISDTQNSSVATNWKRQVSPMADDTSFDGATSFYPDCPWSINGSWSDKQGPILWMHANPTLMMSDASVIDMRGYGTICFDSSNSKLLMKNNSFLKMEGGKFESCNGARLKMKGANSGEPIAGGILADQSQIYMGRIPTYKTNIDPTLIGEHYNNEYGSWMDEGGYIIGEDKNGFNSNGSEDGRIRYVPSSNRYAHFNTYGPQFLIESNASTYSGASLFLMSDQGGNAINTFSRIIQGSPSRISDMMQTTGTSQIISNYMANDSCFSKHIGLTGANMGIRLGSDDAETAFVYNANSKAKVGVEIGLDGTYVNVHLNPHNEYINFSHPDYYQEYVDGNVFKQVNGTSHFEMQDDSSIIMRERQFIGDTERRKWEQTSDNKITFTTNTDYTNLTIEDLLGNLTDCNSFFEAMKEKISASCPVKDNLIIEYATDGVVESVLDGNKYLTTVNNFYYDFFDGHLKEKWNCPIQNSGEHTGPKIQLYNSSNFLMRGVFEPYGKVLEISINRSDFPNLFTQEVINIDNQIDITNFIGNLSVEDQAKIDNLNGTEFQSAEALLIKNSDDDYSGNNRKVKIFFKTLSYGATDASDVETHLDRNTESPVVEFNDTAYLFMNKNSELKLEDSGYIHVKRNSDSSSPNYGKIEYIFGDNANSTSVSFTIDQLQALKNLLT